MIEKLDVLQETRGARGASTFAVSYTVGALPMVSESDEDAFGDTAKADETTRVTIARTPATERDVTAGSHVTWRKERWRVRARQESRGRSQYELTLERTA